MKKFGFYLVTDTHYFEPSLGASGKAFDKYMEREQYFMAESSDIAKAVFADIAADKETEYVIMPGDLSKNGEKVNLNEMLLNTIGNNKGYSDNNVIINLDEKTEV